MTIYQLLQVKLKALRDSGLTNRELAEMAGCSHQQINRMLNMGPEYFETVGLKTLVKLFPELFRTITAQGNNATANGNGAAAAVNGTAIASCQAQSLDGLAGKVLDDEGLCDKCKVRVLKILKGQ